MEPTAQPPHDLAELGERGITPFSALALRSVGAIALLSFVLVQPPDLGSCGRSLQSLQFSVEVGNHCISEPLWWSLSCALVVFLARLFTGWAQAGFSTWSNKRLFHPDATAHGDSPLVVVGVPVIAAGVGIVMGVVVGSALRELLVGLRPYMDVATEYSQGIAVVAIFLLAILAIGGWFVARWRTMITYKVGKGAKG